MDSNNHSRLILSFIVITGVFLSGLSGWSFYKAEEKSIIIEFHKDVDARAASLYREMMINFETLRSLSILFNSDKIPNRELFSRETKKILDRHPDMLALEWIPRIIQSERARYESKQDQKHPNFKITERHAQGNMVTAGKRAEYFPVYYVEPLAGNEAAFGFDLASNTSRLEVLEKSRDSSAPLATASIILVQENENQKGFLTVLPIYKGNPTTLSERKENLKGFVLGVYRLRDIFNTSALNDEMLGIEMKLIDETLPSSHDVLHFHKSRSGLAALKNISYKKELPELWGRKWNITASPTASYITAKRSQLPLVVFVSGIVFSLLIAFYILTITRRTKTIQKIVTEKTNALNTANKKLKKLLRIDALTGIANRRFMDEFLNKEWRRATRNGTSISFILVDVDFFKPFNDNYGHPEGDECLRRVAITLKKLVRRPGDLVARYGGEEFALVLSDTDEAELMANNCRQSIEELLIPHGFSEVADVVTISVGLCTVAPKKQMDPGIIINAADKALYKAKAAGKNRVEIMSLSDSGAEDTATLKIVV